MSELRGSSPEVLVDPGEQGKDRRPELTRRQFLKLFGVGSLAALANRSVEAGSGTPQQESQERAARRIQTGALAGVRTRGSLLEHYFGRYDSLPSEIVVDFGQQLRTMWDLKLRRYGRRPELVQIADVVCEEYDLRTPRSASVEEYAGEVQGMVEQMLHSFDWRLLGTEKRIDPVSLELVRAIAERISYKELFALCMTELLPMPTAKQNMQVLDLLLHAAGPDFLERIPALFDRYVSFGPYQFTKFALSETENRAVGASRMNAILPPDLRLPSRIELLRSIHHHVAAIAFMLENTCLLVAQAKQRGLIERLWVAVEERPEQVMAFLGAAHHAPQAACEAMLSWLQRSEGREFAQVVRSEPGAYAKRYARNLYGLYRESDPGSVET